MKKKVEDNDERIHPHELIVEGIKAEVDSGKKVKTFGTLEKRRDFV